MTDDLDETTLERFAIQTEHLEPKDADFEWRRLIAKERSRRKYQGMIPNEIRSEHSSEMV